MRFEWDPAKNRRNLRKHGLSFDEAVQVFAETNSALEFFDEQHSQDEDRFITLGPTRGGLVLVAWTEITDEVIRLISARRATSRERTLYHRRMERQR